MNKFVKFSELPFWTMFLVIVTIGFIVAVGIWFLFWMVPQWSLWTGLNVPCSDSLCELRWGR